MKTNREIKDIMQEADNGKLKKNPPTKTL